MRDQDNHCRLSADRWPRRRMFGVLPIFVLALLIAGCQLSEERDTAEEEPPPVTEPVAEPEPEPIADADLSTALGYLESGQADQALALLEQLAEDAPNSEVLARLMRQIEDPVEQLLPGPYRRVEVGPGESLSLIAARELGDPLRFYALARLNGIEVPALIPVGTVLRIPESPGSEPTEDGTQAQRSPISAREIESVAGYLARSGKVDQARHMLIGRLENGNAPTSTQELLARITLERALQLRTEGEFDLATSMIDEAIAAVDVPEPRSKLLRARSATQSLMYYQEAVDLRRQGELLAAYEVSLRATDLEFPPDEAVQLVEELRDELVDSLHNDALIAWRDRNVDLAIRKWETLRAVVPDFEPAKVYLERARRLRRRLVEP